MSDSLKKSPDLDTDPSKLHRNTAKNQRNEQIQDWHHEFSLLLNRAFPQQVSAEIQVAKGRLDFVLKTRKNAPTTFLASFFRGLPLEAGRILVLELKTWHESLTLSKVFRFAGKVLNYLADQLSGKNIDSSIEEIEQTKAYLISTRAPFWLNKKEVKGILNPQQINQGHYFLGTLFGVEVYLTVINQLPVTRENYGLLTLSSGLKRKEFINYLLDKVHEEKSSHIFLEWMYFHFPNEVL